MCDGCWYACLHRALLKEDWEEAVNLIIAGNNSENLAFRKIWLDTKDTKKTLEALENRHYIERVVLRSLLRRPTDFFGAVKCVSAAHLCACLTIWMSVYVGVFRHAWSSCVCVMHCTGIFTNGA